MRQAAVGAAYPARHALPQLRALFCERGLAASSPADLRASSPGVAPSARLGARLGLHRPPKDSVHAREERRGGYLFYVPEQWDGEAPLPLVVALHGKDSDGPTFFWQLLPHASSRGFALLSPSSLGLSWESPPPSWALPDPKRKGADADVDNILTIVDEVRAHADRARDDSPRSARDPPEIRPR